MTGHPIDEETGESSGSNEAVLALSKNIMKLTAGTGCAFDASVQTSAFAAASFQLHQKVLT
jgi:hypothetical protein